MKPFQNIRGKMNRAVVFGIAILFIGCALIVFGTLRGNSDDGRQKDATEARLKDMIEELDGVENASVMLLVDDDGKIGGAAVVCEGGDDADNQKTIIELITSLFGIGASKVFVGGK